MRMGILKDCVDYQISLVRPSPSSGEGLKPQHSQSSPRQKAGQDTEGAALRTDAVFDYHVFSVSSTKRGAHLRK